MSDLVSCIVLFRYLVLFQNDVMIGSIYDVICVE